MLGSLPHQLGFPYTLMERLGVSLATLKRDLTYMKDRLHAPIRFDRSLNGYRYDDDQKRIVPQFDLPGLWFSAEEIHALLTMQHLLANLDPGGLLEPHIQPLLSRLSGLLGTGDGSTEEIQKRIHIETVGAREFQLDHFQIIGSALIRRKRLVIRYRARGTDEVTEREVSPQRLVHYRDNWYLDAWCHLGHLAFLAGTGTVDSDRALASSAERSITRGQQLPAARNVR